jgi:hypothetical protein
MKITLAQVIAVVSGLAGVAGAVLVPTCGTALAGEVQAVLEAVSGILVIIAGTHATSLVYVKAKLSAQREDDMIRQVLRQANKLT